ncbi:putative disease resistance protein RGA3 [Tasmannia lanceolata]|uniref:putative disease resistance protein RGA3 n=1 Tax=Tasmannia lanceolata TaxID=3420 RepID=UPI0040640C7B
MTKKRCCLNEIDPLQVSLKEVLSCKRFLLVLDDVWNDCDWQRLQVFNDFVLWKTYFLARVWQMVSRGFRPSVFFLNRICHIPLLLKRFSACTAIHLKEFNIQLKITWSSGVIDDEDRGDDEDMMKMQLVKTIGKDIAKKCKGLPLAMEALGGLLRTNTNENRWKNILQSDMWEISEMEKNIIPILKVRYDNLPACLKQCFVYCSLYPKDYKFEKDTLIQLWIAEGFIQPEGRK